MVTAYYLILSKKLYINMIEISNKLVIIKDN